MCCLLSLKCLLKCAKPGLSGCGAHRALYMGLLMTVSSPEIRLSSRASFKAVSGLSFQGSVSYVLCAVKVLIL